MDAKDALFEKLSANSLFASVPRKVLEPLIEVTFLESVGPGQRLLSEGDASREIYVLLEGTLGVFYSSAAGGDVLVKVFGAPAVFGEMEAFFDVPRMEYVEAFEEAEVAKLPVKAVLDILKTNAGASFALVQDLSARLCIAAYNERSLAFHSVEVRLSHLFLTFVEAFPSPAAGPTHLGLRLTHAQLARCLGVTERSIERTLSTWTKEGWVKKSQGHFTFSSLEPLRDRADPERLVLFSKLGHAPSPTN